MWKLFRRPPRHRRDASSMAWRCRFLTARRSQHGTLGDFHTGRRCSKAHTQNCGSSLHTLSYDSPAWGPTEKVVRGPVSAGLSTRTPGVGLKSRAVAAVAVARRRSIMGGQHARSSVRGGRRAALSRGIGGRRPGPPLVVRGAPSTGFWGRRQPVFTSEALLPGEPVVRCRSNSGAIPALSSSREQPCADASLGSCSS